MFRGFVIIVMFFFFFTVNPSIGGGYLLPHECIPTEPRPEGEGLD